MTIATRSRSRRLLSEPVDDDCRGVEPRSGRLLQLRIDVKQRRPRHRKPDGQGGRSTPVRVVSAKIPSMRDTVNLGPSRCQAMRSLFQGRNELLDSLLEAFPEPDLPRVTCVFSTVAQSIVWQQLSASAAKATWLRLLQFLDIVDKESTGCDPVSLDPARFVGVSTMELRTLGLSERKASYLLNAAAMFRADGSLHVLDLKSMPENDIRTLLLSLPGVGNWTVDMVLLFALGREDILPVGDLAVKRGAKELFRLRSLPSEAQLIQLAEEYRPMRSYLSFYLWKASGPAFVIPDLGSTLTGS
mmetsp:Transcript_15581/g.31518  ORF Transcript_15581/g.31518 Transcript_15581/m.31518 type:complete len:301 (-) Transcript_15581:1077-1979(-)